jgi:hypothetical protein
MSQSTQFLRNFTCGRQNSILVGGNGPWRKLGKYLAPPFATNVALCQKLAITIAKQNTDDDWIEIENVLDRVAPVTEQGKLCSRCSPLQYGPLDLRIGQMRLQIPQTSVQGAQAVLNIAVHSRPQFRFVHQIKGFDGCHGFDLQRRQPRMLTSTTASRSICVS